jgi:hypothetical protein
MRVRQPLRLFPPTTTLRRIPRQRLAKQDPWKPSSFGCSGPRSTAVPSMLRGACDQSDGLPVGSVLISVIAFWNFVLDW